MIQTCTCNYEYFADNGVCVKYAQKVNDSCELSFLVCKGVKNSYCYENKCQCRWGYTKVDDNKCYPTLNGACKFNSISPEEKCYGDNVKCSVDNQCICEDGYVQHMRECLKKAVGVDKGACVLDIQCAHLPNSYCNLTCQCIPTYSPQLISGSRTQYECVKAFNAPCGEKIGCGSKSMVCQNSRCKCADWYYEHGDICNLQTYILNESCYYHNACAYPNWICYNNRCQCDWNYFEEGGKCVKGLHAPCILDDECKKKNSVCINEKCACKENFVEYIGECESRTSIGK
ncbi:prion-like-(Q/N-rich) domain-bearing protein 25 [Cotesia glomerata]|uniref:prion-like-(Q/N-rich) domain-bearing protein 25 n=1 Tax=Cotesia glomerata TaxID=32391 RepID=UPI001D01183E|nr:prion-like-(Q/N-rich) domain-bearing protein 25 [Cotesia glomerata]